MKDHYTLLKNFLEKHFPAQVHKLDAIKDNDVEVIKMYNTWKRAAEDKLQERQESADTENKSQEVAKGIATAINNVDESLHYEDFAKAVAITLKENYGTHNIAPFMKVLHAKLGMNESLKQIDAIDIKTQEDPKFLDKVKAATEKAEKGDTDDLNMIMAMPLDFPMLDEEVNDSDLDNAIYRLENVYKYLDIEYKETKRGEKYIQINYIPVTSPQSQNPEWVNVRYNNDEDLKIIKNRLDFPMLEAEIDYEKEKTWRIQDKFPIEVTVKKGWTGETKASDILTTSGDVKAINKDVLKHTVKHSKSNNTHQVWLGDEIVTDFATKERADAEAKRLNALQNVNEAKATCCHRCGRVHVKGTPCKKPYLKGKDSCAIKEVQDLQEEYNKIKETKSAPKGHYFTKSGNLVKGRMTKDAEERGARKSDPKDKMRSKVPKVTQHTETLKEFYNK